MRYSNSERPVRVLRVKVRQGAIDDMVVTASVSDEIIGFFDRGNDLMYEFRRTDIEELLKGV